MAKFALIFDLKKGSPKDIYVVLNDTIKGELYFKKHLESVKEVGGSVWFIMKGLVDALQSVQEMPERVKRELNSYSLVRFTDLATDDLR